MFTIQDLPVMRAVRNYYRTQIISVLQKEAERMEGIMFKVDKKKNAEDYYRMGQSSYSFNKELALQLY